MARPPLDSKSPAKSPCISWIISGHRCLAQAPLLCRPPSAPVSRLPRQKDSRSCVTPRARARRAGTGGFRLDPNSQTQATCGSASSAKRFKRPSLFFFEGRVFKQEAVGQIDAFQGDGDRYWPHGCTKGLLVRAHALCEGPSHLLHPRVGRDIERFAHLAAGHPAHAAAMDGGQKHLHLHGLRIVVIPMASYGRLCRF